MKTNLEPDEESLRRSLRQWRVGTPLPPRFQESVWKRIEQAEADRTVNLRQALQNAVEHLLARRRLAFAYLTVALAVGLVLGGWQARERNSAVDSSLGRRYVQSVDPYHKPGHL